MEGGGAGWFLAHWMTYGAPPMDALAVDSRGLAPGLTVTIVSARRSNVSACNSVSIIRMRNAPLVVTCGFLLS